jgi:hypothetical protein
VAVALAVGVAVGVLGIRTPGLTVLISVGALMTLGLFVAPKAAVGGVAAFLLLQPFLANLAGGIDTPLGIAVRRLHQVVVLAAMLRVVVLLGWRRLPERVSSWVWYLTGFVAAGLLSAIVAGAPLGVAALGAFLAVKFPVFLLMILTVNWNERDAVQLVRLGLIITPVLLAIGALFLILPPEATSLFLDPTAELEGFFSRSGLRSMQAPFAHPGAFGWAMAVGGCVGIAQLLSRKTLGAACALGSSTVGMVASLRRRPLIALAVAAATAVFASGRRGQRRAILLLVLAVAAAAALLGGGRVRAVISDTMLSYFDPTATTAARTLLYVTGWRIASEHFPLGAGFGRFGGYASQLYYSPLYDQYGLSSVYGLSRDFPAYISDTYWPHILGETGAVGALFLVAFLFRVLYKCVQISRRASSEYVKVLALIAAMVLLEAVIESAVAPIFDSALQAYIVAIPVGVTLVLGAPDAGSILGSPAPGHLRSEQDRS